MKKLFYIIAAALSLTFFVTGCSTVPFTERSRVLMTSESSENDMGAEAWQELKSQQKISKDPALNNAVKKVSTDIARIAEKPDYQWEFAVFESAEPNAFCLPGGKVGVYSGIFKYMNNEAELAAIVGHEVGHAIARHGGERMTHGIVQQIGMIGLSLGTSNQNILDAYGAVTNVAGVLPYSRLHEYEADHIGMILMSKAGYDPHGAISFWEKFKTISQESSLAEFFSTHPMSEKRLQEMQGYLPEAMGYYQKARVKQGLGASIKAQ
ncbi:MAG: hypothetical protein A2020_00860 [Lentisphaerae bacterium GWF2_45_14]|nr:MAG: hypothetical protein A2020_00860 [Lentisphaerae bacterium GWF2_45_14]